MKGSMRAATAIGVGYLLGRRKKFRIATMVAVATAVGGTTVGGIAMKRGLKMLGSTDALQKVAPQLGQLTETVTGDLLSAGKAAATAAVSNRMDALTDSLRDRAEKVRNPEAVVAEGADTATKTGTKAAGAGKRAAGGMAKRASSTVGGAGRRVTGRGRAEEAETDEPEDEDYGSRDEDVRDEDIRDDYEADDDYPDEEDDYEAEADDRADDDADDEASTRPARRARPARPARSGGTPRRSPVTRTRG